MKKILYIDKFFSEDLYQQFSSESLVCEYNHTNDAKRSFRSEVINSNLHEKFIEHVKENLGIEIIKYDLAFYKRKNSIFNPHTDGYPIQILIYLSGEICDIDNGTFFMDNDSMVLRTSNVPNSAIVFDGRYVHGSVQALSAIEDRGWRYSLNCFISEYK